MNPPSSKKMSKAPLAFGVATHPFCTFLQIGSAARHSAEQSLRVCWSLRGSLLPPHAWGMPHKRKLDLPPPNRQLVGVSIFSRLVDFFLQVVLLEISVGPESFGAVPCSGCTSWPSGVFLSSKGVSLRRHFFFCLRPDGRRCTLLGRFRSRSRKPSSRRYLIFGLPLLNMEDHRCTSLVWVSLPQRFHRVVVSPF